MKELSRESKASVKTLQRLFKNYLDNPPRFKIRLSGNCHLLIDGTYFKNNFCVLNYFDSDLNHLQYFRIVERENYYNYLTDLEFLKQLRINIISITSDGQKGLIKAISDVFPGIVHQRCVIHIQRLSLAYLTRFPKTIAGVELRSLVKELHKIESYKQKDLWISLFENWCKNHNEFLKEKSVSFSGRKWYTHKLLRRTRALINNALPNMFHYLNDPKIPKSTNGLESRFSYLKNNLKIHRGLTRESRKNFIRWYYYFKYNP